jgi:hypothetical protein
VILIIAALIQSTFYYSPENLFAVACSLIGWFLTDYYIFTAYILYRFTFSTIIILGFSLTQFCLPLIFTLAEGKPITFNLDLPNEVFTHSLLAVIVIIIAHGIYRSTQRSNNLLRDQMQTMFKKAHMFTPPSDAQLWIIGFIGLIGMIGTFLTSTKFGVTDAERGFAPKVFQALIPFSYAPYFLYLKELFGKKTHITKRSLLLLAGFTVLIFIVGIGGNQRSLIVKGLVSMGLAYGLGLLLGKFSVRFFTPKNIILAGLGLWLLIGPVSDLGTAMVVVRSERTDLTRKELIAKTLAAYKDKKLLSDYKKDALASAVYDEYYFDDIFLARFCNLKFNDEGLIQYHMVGPQDHQMKKISIDKIWASFPQPMLSALNVKLDKEYLISASFGDFLYDQAGGQNALGGFRTGQFASTGMAAFGWWYLAILGVGMIPIFFLLDLLVVFRLTNVSGQSFDNSLSLAGLTAITSFFQFLSLGSTSESVVNIPIFLLRGLPQMLLLYWLVFYISKKLTTGFNSRPLPKTVSKR